MTPGPGWEDGWGSQHMYSMGQDEAPPWEQPGAWDESWNPVVGGAKGGMASLSIGTARLSQANTFKELVQENSDDEEPEKCTSEIRKPPGITVNIKTKSEVEAQMMKQKSVEKESLKKRREANRTMCEHEEK